MKPYIFFIGALACLSALIFLLASDLGCAPLPAYLAGVNGALFGVCGFDKSIAPSTALRAPERVLLLFAALGGSLGLALGMAAFRHKTRKRPFHISLGVIIVVQLAALRFIVR